jgi:hypothetical protein
MKNADRTAAPNRSQSPDNPFGGLTKREMFAMHALPSVIKWLDYGVERGEWGDWNFEDAASHAVIAADALLKELEK